MRILAIGVGGAGCRIANALYANDRKSSKVACVQALAVDIDRDTIHQLQALPDQAKICFMDIEPEVSPDKDESRPATIDIGEIIARIQNRESGETDAILICCGLGGSLTDIVPHLISALRTSVTEPIFGLVTLPTLSEGEKRSAKAADDIENIAPLLDATILFDNETWLKKIAARRDALVEELSKGPGLFGFGKNTPKLSAQDITFKLLNQSIIRRISLILRAGEFRADGGIDLAEVVMDSSEVLNTITGMGFVTIGYAVEQLPQNPLAFFSRLRQPNDAEEQRKSAERIIELAKRAIYQEVSIPCDMTSAAKALVLVAGPSHEISMKGFMTVRKWIDRSIAGMETRSGDYPVTNSKFVAIIVVLSGLENIPRITELREIREQYRSGGSWQGADALDLPPAGRGNASSRSAFTVTWAGTELRDEMILLPGQKGTPTKHPSQLPDDNMSPDPYEGLPEVLIPQEVRTNARQPARPVQVPEDRDLPRATRVTPAPVQPVFPSIRKEEPVTRSVPSRGAEETQSFSQTPRTPVKKSLESEYERLPSLKHTQAKNRGTDHLMLERDLQKHHAPVKPESNTDRESSRILVRTQTSPSPDTKILIRKSSSKIQARPSVPVTDTTAPSAPVEKTVVRIRRKSSKTEETGDYRKPDTPSGPARQEELEVPAETEDVPQDASLDESLIEIRDRLLPAHDDIFFGKAVSQKTSLQAKDRALLHTDIKRKKGGEVLPQEGAASKGSGDASAPVKKKTGKPSTPDDTISWVNE
ncbi:MAG: hypothetical protein LUQ31_06555 [Methanoregula sp.]|nr:hypothetical protein [Methanoregula sp.]